MKALSLTQPWATLVIIGAKQYETRSWATKYRGPLAIQAAKGWPVWATRIIWQQPFTRTLYNALGEDWFPPVDRARGHIIGVVDLVDCVPTESIRGSLSENELAFGDYSDGRYAWKLANIRRLPEPIPATGRLGLWEIDL